MFLNNIFERIRNKFKRWSARIAAKHIFYMRNSVPLISFAFDDFPKSAYVSGGGILKKYGFAGTFYVSLGILGNESPMGRLATRDDLIKLIADGHEIGCHTYDHLDAWNTRPDIFEESILRNKQEIKEILPTTSLRTFAFPIGNATPATKRIVGKHFLCARGGYLTFNKGKIDFNGLNSFFLDSRLKYSISDIKRLIDENCSKNGWLIFTTHDIRDTPSRYGCTCNFFKQVVIYSASSGAKVIPVLKAYKTLVNM